MDRLQAMTAFLAVVDGGGFAAAARRLRLSPPVVTRAVAELEARLGVRLLTRTTRVVRVTEAGARYADDCRRVLAAVDEAEEAAIGSHAVPRGHLTVTAPVLFGALFVTPIVTHYLERYPEVDASCWFVDRVVNLVEEGVDAAVRIGELPDSSLQAVRVGQVRRVICASPAYLARAGTPATPDELAQHCIVSARGVTPSPDWDVNDGDNLRVVKLRPRLTSTSNDAAIAAALGGFGLTRLLSYQVAEHLRDGRLQRVLGAYETVPSPVHVVHREGRHASPKVRAFLDVAIAALRANPALA
jgi:DNA-binding transcriptional LysR family regulator